MIEELFRETLKKHQLRRTTERVRLFQELKDLKVPCSISDLVERTKDSLDMTTVYRNLDTFEANGIITRVYTGWKYKVELSDMFRDHHHHMSCTNCGNIISFEESDEFVNELKKLEMIHGFKAESHSLELKGLCKNCC
jgi:Fur family ferric uptake transcriptional regulator